MTTVRTASGRQCAPVAPLILVFVLAAAVSVTRWAVQVKTPSLGIQRHDTRYSTPIFDSLVDATDFLKATTVRAMGDFSSVSYVDKHAEQYIDHSAEPCDDFYQYACGSWLKTFDMPKAYTSWQLSFSEVEHKMTNKLRRLLSSDDGAAGQLYRSCINLTAIEALGTRPFDDDDDARLVTRMNNTASALVDAVAALQRRDVSALFSFSVEADMSDPSRHVLYLEQGGLTLPDRSYYIDVAKRPQLEAVKQAMVRMMGLVGCNQSAAEDWASQTLKVERKIAGFSRDQSTLRRMITAKLTTIRELTNEFPLWDWLSLWRRIGIDRSALSRLKFNMADRSFFHSLSRLVVTQEPLFWQPYLRWQNLLASSINLGQPFIDIGLTMREALYGKAAPPPRWRMCVNRLKHDVPRLIERLYIVESGFDNRSLTTVTNMLEELRGVFHADIDQRAWIDRPVGAAAHRKLDAMLFNVGHPKIDGTFDATVQPKLWYQNSVTISKVRVQQLLTRLSSGVERSSWAEASALDVNTLYDMHKNAIFVPVGILQPPFFSEQYSDAWNFGALGALLAHEMIHGFDDQGRQFGPDGKLHQWWDNHTENAYTTHARCLERYYSRMSIDGVHANGKLELGENIADNGALRLAWAALAARDQGSQLHSNGGGRRFAMWRAKQHSALLPSQPANHRKEFFVSWAQQWCEKAEPQTVRSEIMTDPHPPGRFRVNGPFGLMPEFAAAFGCPADSAMNSSKVSCRLW